MIILEVNIRNLRIAKCMSVVLRTTKRSITLDELNIRLKKIHYRKFDVTLNSTGTVITCNIGATSFA